MTVADLLLGAVLCIFIYIILKRKNKINESQSSINKRACLF